MVERYLQLLFKAQTELEKGSMQFPAADYAAYQRKVGEWIGLQKAIDELLLLIEDKAETD